MFEFSDEVQNSISRVRKTDTDTFSELVRIGGLNPKEDFKYANLQDVDFTGSNLSEFNFNFADLRGATWEAEEPQIPESFRYALRGRKRDPIRSIDYSAIAERALTANTWRERFLSFALAVDNFGEVDLTLDILQKTLHLDNSKYMKFTSALYFIASYLRHSEALDYCRTMALASNSYTNMYRFKKLSRLLNELRGYLDSTNPKLTYPGIVSSGNVVKLTMKLME